MRIEAGRRAVKFEERMGRSENRILREMYREVERGRAGGVLASDRRKFWERVGLGVEEVKRRRDRGESLVEWARSRDEEVELQVRDRRIGNSRYFKEYGLITSGNEYLGGDLGLEEKRTIARFRCGNEFRACEFWREEEQRKCRVCGVGEETVWHLLRGCRGMEVEDMSLNELMSGKGRGLFVMSYMKEAVERSA